MAARVCEKVGGPVLPIYEYECTTQGHRFEVTQKITDEPLKICTVCGAPVRKLISATAFHLKGGGWYSDAYSGGKAAGAKNAPAKTDKVEPKTETKTESKPAPTPEKK